MTESGNFIQTLNEHHAVVMLGGKCLILNEVVEPIFNRPDVTFSSMHDFRNKYANYRKVEHDSKGNEKKIPVTELWLRSSRRREYDGVIFSPGGDVAGYYNLWRGFAAEPRHGDWGLMREHIYIIICNSNEEFYNYFLNWMANLVQNPGGGRPGVSIVLLGGLGFGKGIVVNNFGSLFRGHYKHITHNSKLTGRFNSVLKDALLVFADEVTWGGNNQAAGVLKGLITEPTIQIELKGKDVFEVKNHVSLIIASNSDWAIPAGLNERRFFVLNVSGDRAQDHSYFAAIANQMDNGGREAMLYDLMQRDLSGINLREYPRTDGLTDQIIRSLSHAERYWFELLREGRISDRTPVCSFHEEYLGYARRHNERYPVPDNELGRILRRICPSVQRRNPQYLGSRTWTYFFPDLETARAEFERAVSSPIDWGSDDEEADAVPEPFRLSPELEALL